MKYQRLKSIDGSGTIMRYYELADDVAYANAFYKIANGEATKIVGTVDGAALIGFSHGGNNLAEGLIFLDINPNVVYMGILGEEDEGRPAIGELVNGFQRVIDTHYDGDEGVSGKGTNPEEWGVERLTNPYYLFVIEQPEASDFSGEMDDEEAGEVSGVNFPSGGNRPQPEPAEYTYTIKNSTGYSVTLTATPEEGDVEEETLANGATYILAQEIPAGQTLSTVYTSVIGDCEGELTWEADGSAVMDSDKIGEIAAIRTVTFDTDGGSSVADQLVFNGGKATAPANPTKDTKTFAGWYKDAELTTVFDFATDIITADTTIYAKWTD